MKYAKRFFKRLLEFSGRAGSLWIVAFAIQLPAASTLSGVETTSQTARLQMIRAFRYDTHSTVIFEFGSAFQFEKPEIKGDEVHFRLKNTETALRPYREYEASESWVKLEKIDGDIIVRMGLLGKFYDFHYISLDDPARLAVNLYRDRLFGALPSEDAAIDPENSAAARLDSDDSNLPEKAFEGKDRQTTPIAPHKDSYSAAPVKASQKMAEDKIIDQSPNRRSLTMNFYQVDIQEILSGLAMQQKINIVTAKEVTGEISVHLYQVPLNNALEAICRAGGFRYHQQGNVYYVYKPDKAIDPLTSRLQMRIFKLEYADLNDIQGVLEAIPGIRMIKIHEPSRSIIVEDTPENIAKIETLVRFWDVRPKQVIIEAKILEILLTDEMELGVDWQQVLGDARIGTQGFSRAIMPGAENPSPIPETGDGLFANLITGVGTRHQFTAALDALRSKTKINTLSTPKLLAIHRKPAKVQVGGKQGYTVTTVNQGISTESIEFIDTGTILEITPYIDDQNNILLEISPSLNSAQIEEGIPVVRSTNVTTWMVAKNGETVFIGGLIQEMGLDTQSRIPCLGDIPGLGLLFGRSSKDKEKTELIVLITPQILEDAAPKDQEAAAKIGEAESYFKSKSSSPSSLLNPLIPTK